MPRISFFPPPWFKQLETTNSDKEGHGRKGSRNKRDRLGTKTKKLGCEKHRERPSHKNEDENLCLLWHFFERRAAGKNFPTYQRTDRACACKVEKDIKKV